MREQGFKALKGFLEKLEKASENPEIIPELEAQVKAGGRSGLLSSDKVPQWAGWALKAISGKFYKSAAPQPTENVQENQPENSTSEKPVHKPELIPKDSSDDLDGWGELDEEPVNEINSWTKTVKATREKMENFDDLEEQNEAEDWSTDWEKPTSMSQPKKPTESARSFTTTSAKSNAKGVGTLKLSHAPKQSQADRELNDLLGEFSSNQKTSSTASKKTNDGWNDDFAASPFGDEEIPSKTTNYTGWDDAGWGDTEC